MTDLTVMTVKIFCNCPECGFKNWITAEYQQEYKAKINHFKHKCYYCECKYEVCYSVNIIKQARGIHEQKYNGEWRPPFGQLKDKEDNGNE